VFEALRQRITRGEWEPGTQLRIKEVAALVGTSEMPVREAFRRLAQAGLIVLEPYKGATIPVLHLSDLEHIYDVRIMLEAEAGRQGALCATPAVVATMREHWLLVQEASERGDVVGAVLEDENVLGALYGAGENDVLVGLVRTVWDSCRPYKGLWVSNAVEHGLATWSHIPALIDAASHNDSHLAFRILERTYLDARATVRQLLDRQAPEPGSTGQTGTNR
jgi:DNA-binding GntR family transcriptional regulator